MSMSFLINIVLEISLFIWKAEWWGGGMGEMKADIFPVYTDGRHNQCWARPK